MRYMALVAHAPRAVPGFAQRHAASRPVPRRVCAALVHARVVALLQALCVRGLTRACAPACASPELARQEDRCGWVLLARSGECVPLERRGERVCRVRLGVSLYNVLLLC